MKLYLSYEVRHNCLKYEKHVMDDTQARKDNPGNMVRRTCCESYSFPTDVTNYNSSEWQNQLVKRLHITSYIKMHK